jgi:uncharacterized lipoprotein YajG
MAILLLACCRKQAAVQQLVRVQAAGQQQAVQQISRARSHCQTHGRRREEQVS